MSHFKDFYNDYISDLLTRYPCRDFKKAHKNLSRILEKVEVDLKFTLTQAPAPDVQMTKNTTFPPDLPFFLEKLLQAALEAPDPDNALNNMERYMEAVSEAKSWRLGISKNQASSLQSLISGLQQDSQTGADLATDRPFSILQLLMHLFGTSQYLSDILIRNPHYLDWMVGSDGKDKRTLLPRKSKDLLYQELITTLNAASTEPSASTLKKEKLNLLRVFKKKEILRIGIRDILRYGSVGEITEELSDLADVLIQGAYEICEAALKEKYGIPSYRDAQGELQECKFTVLGMGKLGGRELNFSSDIDLLYLYTSDPGETTGIGPEGQSLAFSGQEPERRNRLINPEYFKKLCMEITSALSDITAEGRVYRVDLRLRPEGKSGNIAYSLRSYELYYESWGETWERLALIKARPVAGDKELGRAFLDMIRPFVYRKYMDYAAINEIKGLKDRIDRKISANGGKNLHVKLGFGGIREIEFSVQALQLLYGGKIPEIQEKNTLLALEKLLRYGLLLEEDYRHLREAYIFLRDVEHKLQIVYEFQTHTLPTDSESLELCARRLGYRPHISSRPSLSLDSGRDFSATEPFMRDYRLHTFRVNRIFQNLFEGSLYASSSPVVPEMTIILDQDLPKEQAYQILNKYGFRDIARTYHNILLLRDGPTFVHYSAKTRGLLANIMPFILDYASKSPDPDQAINNLEKFVSAARARTTLYALLANNPKVIELLIQLFGHSDFLSEILIRYPEMLEVLLDPEVIERPKPKEQMYQELRAMVKEISDWSTRISKLRQFKQAETLRIGLRDIIGKADFPKTLAALAHLADTCVQMAYEIAQDELQSRYGIPHITGSNAEDLLPGLVSDSTSNVCEFAVMALGKLGGQELNYTSDLDVLYVYAVNGMTSGIRDAQGKLTGQIENHLYFLKLVELIHKILSEPGVDPIAFKLDPRLRPEGRKGPLALPFKTYHNYYQTRAETWEHQALTKIRFIAGSEKLGHAFVKMVYDLIYQPVKAEWVSSLRMEIREMKKKMEAKLSRDALERNHHVKLGSGGIVDIEFIVQFLQLQYGFRCLSICQASTLSALEGLYQEGFISEERYKQLRESYIFLRTVENRLGIVQELPIKILPTSPEEKVKLARRLGYFGDQAYEAFLKDYEKHTVAAKEFYKMIFWE